MTFLPRPGYSARMWTYLREMYPLHLRVPAALLLAVSIAAMFQRLHGIAGGWLAPGAALAAWNALLFMLVLRLMDELKDEDVDRVLFRDRPLPSGRVERSDIVTSLVLAIALFLAPNLWSWPTALAAAALLGWALLMFRWFFVPSLMRPNLLLTLATHNPIVPLLVLDLVVVVAVGEGVPLGQLRWLEVALLAAMVWGASFAWEIARKIRAAEEENEYVTYSRLLGRGGAVALATAGQTASFAIALHFWRTLGLHWVFPALLFGAWLGVLWRHAKFLLRPTDQTSKLRAPAEGFAFAVLAAALAGCWIGL